MVSSRLRADSDEVVSCRLAQGNTAHFAQLFSDVYMGRRREILQRRKEIKSETLKARRFRSGTVRGQRSGAEGVRCFGAKMSHFCRRHTETSLWQLRTATVPLGSTVKDEDSLRRKCKGVGWRKPSPLRTVAPRDKSRAQGRG